VSWIRLAGDIHHNYPLCRRPVQFQPTTWRKPASRAQPVVFGSMPAAMDFAFNLSSLATFLSLISAGIAVALQNVILAVVGYFLLIGRARWGLVTA
jgi:hypothetical protein